MVMQSYHILETSSRQFKYMYNKYASETRVVETLKSVWEVFYKALYRKEITKNFVILKCTFCIIL